MKGRSSSAYIQAPCGKGMMKASSTSTINETNRKGKHIQNYKDHDSRGYDPKGYGSKVCDHKGYNRYSKKILPKLGNKRHIVILHGNKAVLKSFGGPARNTQHMESHKKMTISDMSSVNMDNYSFV